VVVNDVERPPGARFGVDCRKRAGDVVGLEQ
jgi:hypothetical protein